MSRRTNIINYIISMAVTLIALFAVVYVCDQRYSEELVDVLPKFLVGAIVAGLINTFAHELAHLIVGKKNGFAFSVITVWFFKWYKVKNKVRFAFTMIGEEAGYTEMIPKNKDNLSTRFKKMTLAGPIASFVLMILGVPAFFVKGMSIWLFCVWSMFLPIGAYIFFTSALPASSYGVRNDGAVAYGINKKDDVSKVTLNLLSIRADMYQGKSPAEVDESLYFDLPQLPEDDINFTMLLNARYLYYLDKEDYENAKKVTERLTGLVDDIPKDFRAPVLAHALYNACTFNYNEDLADDIVYEIEKYLNNVNNAANVRAKLAYLLYVKDETQAFDMFYKKGIKEADMGQIKGLGLFERKLFEKMKQDFDKRQTN
ncbi:MAG: M50 family metallopeptidase [Clostridia bacterium]|nr:M50 family metallopeptidase [Clostridia bacterium]